MANVAPEIKALWPYRDLTREATPVPPASLRDSAPRRGIGLRASTTFPAIVCEGPHSANCMAVELSASGIVIERGRELSEREERSILKLELLLPEQTTPVRVLARVVRRHGPSSYALKFVAISDADRLTLMEHLDHEQQESLRLLNDIAND